LKKSVRYNLLGAFGVVAALIVIMGWASVRGSQVLYEDWFGQAVLYYPLAPALPYLALFEFLLGCLCLVFGYLEGQREVEQEAT
jgi:hypothetical protein